MKTVIKSQNVITALIVIATILMLIATIGGTISAWVVENKTTNYVSLATVSGHIVEEYEQGVTVYPGGTINKKAEVINASNVDAIARVKVLCSWSDKDNSDFLDTEKIDIKYNDDFWVFKDGYYYYTKILKPGDISEPVMTEFSLSEDVGNDYAGATGKIIITLDLLQAGGGAESCWNIEYKDLGIEYVKPSGELLTTTIEFKGSTEGFVFDVNGGDLFHNFKNMVPGESVSQLISVTNNSKEDVELFLWAEPDDVNLDSRQKELLEKYSVLTIADDKGEILYEGALLPEDIESRLHTSLGLFSSRETKNLYLSLKIAPEIGNDFQNLNTSLDWGLKAMGQEFEVPETGDNSNIGVWIGLAGVGAGGFIAACVLAIKQKKEEDDE